MDLTEFVWSIWLEMWKEMVGNDLVWLVTSPYINTLSYRLMYNGAATLYMMLRL